MDFDSLRRLDIVDSHIHLPFPSLGADLERALNEMHIGTINLVSTPDPKEISHNPAVIAYKAAHPQTAYISGGLDHFSVQAHPTEIPQAFADQVRAMHAAGFDGLKLLESKPIARKMINIPLDGPIYAPMWAAVEELGMPVVWHVADPEEFWDRDRCPQWVLDSGWFYGDGSYPLKEELNSEVENVLTRHPHLKVILAHFFFLSADLNRAAAFLDAHPNACFDLTPGSEMYFNFSANLDAARTFFTRYQDRIIFGTDIGASVVGKPGTPLDRAETLGRTFVVRACLENAGKIEIPDGVKHWRRPNQEIQGLAFPDAILNKIYHDNFTHLYGETPKPLNLPKAIEMIAFQASVLDAMAGKPVESTARQVYTQLIS